MNFYLSDIVLQFTDTDLEPSVWKSFFTGMRDAYTLGAPLSIPYSIPLLICLQRYVVRGLSVGLITSFSIACGQTLFFATLVFGLRDFIQSWYDLEFIFFFVGFLLSLYLLFEFPDDSDELGLLKLSAFPLLLVFCNPMHFFSFSELVFTQALIGISHPISYLAGLFAISFEESARIGCLGVIVRIILTRWSRYKEVVFLDATDRLFVACGASLVLVFVGNEINQSFFHPVESLVVRSHLVNEFLPTKVQRFKDKQNFNLRRFNDIDTAMISSSPGESTRTFMHVPMDHFLSTYEKEEHEKHLQRKTDEIEIQRTAEQKRQAILDQILQDEDEAPIVLEFKKDYFLRALDQWTFFQMNLRTPQFVKESFLERITWADYKVGETSNQFIEGKKVDQKQIKGITEVELYRRQVIPNAKLFKANNGKGHDRTKGLYSFIQLKRN